MKPDFTIAPAIPKWEAEAQAEYARGLGFSPPRPRSGSLAVVGGGHSVAAYVETLRRWDGDIWAVNGAYNWCRERDIDATFYTVDPEECTVEFAKGAEKAIVTPWCHPSMWGVLKNVELADFFPMFSASAPNAAWAGFPLGYTSVTYFGIDCSFSDTTHSYMNHDDRATMIVRCGGMDYQTTPAYYVQALEIEALCKLAPKRIRQMCGGLVRALVENDDHDVIYTSPEVSRYLGTMNYLEVAE